jgi:5-methylcytosine-specific restriction endonuclease McrA
MKHLKTLVLNANFMPLSVFPLYTISAQDAIQRVLNDTAVLVYEYERPILTPSRNDLYWPSVVANKNGFRYADSVKLKRETLYYRDHGVCVYCDAPLTMESLSVEHVLPKSRGGKHAWENVVAACTNCNQEKADAMPVGRWVPKKKPYKPNFFQLLEIRKKYPITVYDKNWLQFLPSWTGEVIVKDHASHIVCEEIVE